MITLAILVYWIHCLLNQTLEDYYEVKCEVEREENWL